MEDGDEGVEVARTSRSEEGIDHLALPIEVRFRRWSVGAFDPSPCTTGELPRRIRCSADHGSDLIEWQLEHVVEYKGQPLGGCEGVEHDLESEADGVGEHRLLFWLEVPLGAYDWVWEMHLVRLLAPDVARPKHVQTHAGDDRRQPPP
jgi:hypothetical protein